MSEGTPKMQLPRSIEPRKLAQSGITLSGAVPAVALERLREAVLSIGEMEAELRFQLDFERRPQVAGRLIGSLERQCQRCLEPVKVDVESEFLLGIVINEEQARSLPASVDPWLVPEDYGDLYGMLEDEILLSLPFVAFHDSDCLGDIREKYTEGLADIEPVANPFKVLEQLKSKK